MASRCFQWVRGQTEKRIWKSGTQEKKPTMNFATKNNLAPSDDGSTEEKQSAKYVKNCARHSNRKYHDNLSDNYLFSFSS